MATFAQNLASTVVAIRSKFNAITPKLVPTGGTTGQVLAKASATDNDVSWITPAAGGGGGSSATNVLSTASMLQVRHEVANRAEGGSSIVGTQIRPLNTVKVNTISGASLSSNIITLPAGTYYCEINPIVYAVQSTQCFLRSESSMTYVLSSLSSFISNGVQGPVPLKGSFTTTGGNFTIQNYTSVAKATNGYGTYAGSGQTEVYCDAIFWKVV